MAKLHAYHEDVSFYHFDEYAKKITSKKITSINDIVRHLERGVGEDRSDRDLYLVRGFLVWLSLAYEDKSKFNFERYNELIEHLASLFENFCRAANIECVLVNGKAKAKGYKVGDKTLESSHTWASFKVDGYWHLFDPIWCVIEIAGFSHGGEILLEIDGQKAMRQTDHTEGQNVQVFEEFWFCTAPAVFLYSHLPDDPKWQLCQESESPITLEEWLNYPYCKNSFFNLNLRILSEESCRIKANNGRCNVHILAQENTAKLLMFSNRLYLSKQDSDNVLDSDNWPLLVLAGRDLDIVMFEVRLPVVGKYRLQLFFGQDSEVLQCCCEFSIECEEPDPKCRKLPINPSVGFGFGGLAEEAGLRNPSVTGPKIFAKSPQIDSSNDVDEVDIQMVTFYIDEESMKEEEYGSFLCSSSKTTYFEPKLDESRRRIDVTPKVLSDDDEYAVMVAKRPIRSDELFKPFLYYLVTFENDKEYSMRLLAAKRRKGELIMDRKKAKKLKRKAYLQNKIQELRANIDDHVKQESDHETSFRMFQRWPYLEKDETIDKPADAEKKSVREGSNSEGSQAENHVFEHATPYYDEDSELHERLSFDDPSSDIHDDGDDCFQTLNGFQERSLISDGDEIFDVVVQNNESQCPAYLKTHKDSYADTNSEDKPSQNADINSSEVYSFRSKEKSELSRELDKHLFEDANDWLPPSPDLSHGTSPLSARKEHSDFSEETGKTAPVIEHDWLAPNPDLGQRSTGTLFQEQAEPNDKRTDKKESHTGSPRDADQNTLPMSKGGRNERAIQKAKFLNTSASHEKMPSLPSNTNDTPVIYGKKKKRRKQI